MTEDCISIGIADDHQLITSSLSEFLKLNLNCEIVFIARNGKELVSEMKHNHADLILLDIKMPKLDGLEALRILKSRNAKQKIIVLSMHSDENLLLRLIKLRVNGYLPKSASGEELLKAIENVMEKGHYFNENLVRAMYQETIDEEDEENVLGVLDDIDIEILKLICEEKTSREIAETLHLSPRTIEGRRKRLITKIGTKNQAGLVIFAIKEGLYKV